MSPQQLKRPPDGCQRGFASLGTAEDYRHVRLDGHVLRHSPSFPGLARPSCKKKDPGHGTPENKYRADAGDLEESSECRSGVLAQAPTLYSVRVSATYGLTPRSLLGPLIACFSDVVVALLRLLWCVTSLAIRPPLLAPTWNSLYCVVLLGDWAGWAALAGTFFLDSGIALPYWYPLRVLMFLCDTAGWAGLEIWRVQWLRATERWYFAAGDRCDATVARDLDDVALADLIWHGCDLGIDVFNVLGSWACFSLLTICGVAWSWRCHISLLACASIVWHSDGFVGTVPVYDAAALGAGHGTEADASLARDLDDLVLVLWDSVDVFKFCHADEIWATEQPVCEHTNTPLSTLFPSPTTKNQQLRCASTVLGNRSHHHLHGSAVSTSRLFGVNQTSVESNVSLI